MEKLGESRDLKSFLLKTFTRPYVEKLFKKKCVKVNGKRAYEDTGLQIGDKVVFYLPFEEKQVNFDVLLDTADFMVINKPAGVVVHEGETVSEGQSLIGMMRKKYPDLFLVHRLDAASSGCLILAKGRTNAEYFMKMFKRGDFEKIYLVLVRGNFQSESGKLKTEISGRSGVQVMAETDFDVMDYSNEENVSFLRVQILTGRKHQIRKQFSLDGYPVVLDDKYGDFTFNKEFKKKFKLRRQFLHSYEISFNWKNKKYRVKARLPDDLKKTLQLLRFSEGF